MFILNLSALADQDLEDILMYSIKTFGERQAIIYSKEINEALIKTAKILTIGHSRNDVPSPYLSYIVGQHILIYLVDEILNEVTIIRILHSRMDFSSRF